jgi:AcrR family transcriptional regulator
MSRAGRPRVHLHVSRETIAQTALKLVDRDGLEALSLRNVAGDLGVGPMTLYGHVRTRDEIVSDVVGLLLAEVDTTELPGESWDEGLRRVAFSVREMALRHPNAFSLLATAPVDQPPVLDYAHSLARLRVAQGIAEEQFTASWSVVDAFLTGFLLMETAAIARARSGEGDRADAASEPEQFQRLMATVQSAEAFAAALEVVIAGLECAGDASAEQAAT